MAQEKRQQAVHDILRTLHKNADKGLRELFAELNYDYVGQSLSSRKWPESAKLHLADDPILFAAGGENDAFHVIYTRLEGDTLLRSAERPIVNQFLRDHPYALFAFSTKNRSDWHFLNVKYDEAAEKRRLIRRIAVRQGEGLRTAAERLALLDLEAIDSNLTQISPLTIQQQHDEAFDVEKVTKDFYREIANWYFWALKHATFPKDAPKEKDGYDHISIIRLITRLIFCWFIREKGLIPDVLFDEKRVAAMLKGFAPKDADDADSVYYRAILQNLFFATLNTEMDQRGWRRADQNFMAHSLYRHKDCFRDPKAGLEWFKDIPFLNGGLFECLDRDFGEDAKPRYLRIDGFSDRPDSQPTVPDCLFFGPDQEVDLSDDYGDKKFRKVRVRGLIDTLNHYKFTIEENTPFDQEVALDPELCGKVFENLLAAYNPETGTTARKSTGSFYTPREIVDYMVDESLLAYLKGKIEPRMDANGHGLKKGKKESSKHPCESVSIRGSSDDRLRKLLAYDAEGHDFSESETERLIYAVDDLKVLDPAVGSGAFPMGVLHKLVHVLGRLDPDNERWKAKQIAKLDDAVMREEAEKAFRENYDNYGRKLYLIENCIYGVDIQPIAVQIAKMRFFISLIVDQKVNPKAPNLGVRALPNLETKFVAANTLIGIERPEQMMLRNPEIDKKEAELRKVRERHFTARTLKAKARCREEDKRLRAEIADLLKTDGWDNATAKQLAAWDPYDQNASAEFFDPEWMFGITDGFDVVIGNPPYFNLNTVSKDFIAYLKAKFADIHTGYNDIVYYFLAIGIRFLSECGVAALISSNYFIGNEYAQKLRSCLSQHLVKLINFKEYQVFSEASVHTCISILHRKPLSPHVSFHMATENCLNTDHALENRMRAVTIPRDNLERQWLISDPRERELIDKLHCSSVLLGDIARIEKGSTSGMNAVFTMSSETARSLSIENELLRRNVKNSDIGRYVIRDRGDVLIYIDNNVDLTRYPKAMAYLSKHRPALAARNEVKNGAYYWYRFDRPRNREVFDAAEKIVVPYRAPHNCFALDDQHCFNDGGDIRAIVLQEDSYSHKYVLGLLNSQLLDWFFGFIGKPKGNSREYFNSPMVQIPIKKPTDVLLVSAIERLVTRILAAKAADPSADTSALEREIDERVYQLYGLTEEEIKIVEGGAPNP